MEKEIAIIIPAYNAHDTIEKLLFSIAAQTKVDLVKIILIDDCSEKDYSYLIDKFYFLDLLIIRMETNSGPGESRNKGIKYAIKKDIPYIVFADADDIFLNNLFLETGLKEIQNADLVFSHFYEVSKQELVPHDDYDIWLFGKFYKTSIIKEHNIVFKGNSYSNEDVAFNLWYVLCCDHKIKLDFFTYLWMDNPNSITRTKENYFPLTAYPRMCENLRFVYLELEKDNTISKDKIKQSIINRIIRLYNGFNGVYYCEDENYKEKEWIIALHNLYKDCWEKYISNITIEELKVEWEVSAAMEIPRISFPDFLQKIKEG